MMSPLLSPKSESESAMLGQVLTDSRKTLFIKTPENIHLKPVRIEAGFGWNGFNETLNANGKEKPMRKRILFILSTFTLLVHPLTLLAQNSFSLSLDVNSTTGDQAATSINVSADEVVTIQVFGKDIQNANGLAVRFEYNATQIVYEGFETGDVLPNAQALTEQGTNPTFVEISIVSFGGQATVNNGLVSTIRFRTLAAFSGTSDSVGAC